MAAIFLRFSFDDFMININCGLRVLHVKRQILTYFFVTSFLCSLQFSLFQLIGHTKRCIQKNIKKFLWLSFCVMIVPSKAMHRPCDLDLWPYMLNVAHVKNDVKWRLIVTKFGTLIENMSRMGLYDCHIF